ncbi:MAG: PHP domain-containing protein [Oscillospiraceae bacterium]|nr:PHP domain-containing protein [Oscillospiraceae bacterium]
MEKLKILIDTHTHSNLSDGGNSPQEMLNAAISAAEKRGLKVFALTDHFDIHAQSPQPLSPFDGAGRESSYATLSGLKCENPALKFLKGIEIGQAHQFRKIAEDWLNSHEYDFVLGSCHIVRGKIDFYNMDYNANPPNTLLKQYFEELHELCSWCRESGSKHFDSLAHLTYPLRYMRGKGDITEHKSAIDKLFTLMVENEIALEINTGCGNALCPDFPQVKRFYELGGRLITLGSDSHNAGSIGAGITSATEMAKSAGFAECAYYEKRQMKFIKI